MECKHNKKENEGYHYDIGNDEEVWLCNNCNMNLAGEILKQLAIEGFLK